MATFTPITAGSAGSYNGQGRPSAIIDSTYGTLGGTYGAIGYGYGGFVTKFGGQSNGVTPSFTPGPGSSSTPFTPQTIGIGNFNPS